MFKYSSISLAAILLLITGKTLAQNLFDERFEGDLRNWTGKNNGSHSGTIVEDPLRLENHVVTFSARGDGGDLFSISLTPSPDLAVWLRFDYLGKSRDAQGWIGYSRDTTGNTTRWVGGARDVDPPGIVLVSDERWHAYSIQLFPQFPRASPFRIVIEDHTAPYFDVFFDNIQVYQGDPPQFVGTDQTSFVLDGSEFRFVGANNYLLAHLAKIRERGTVRSILDDMCDRGMTVLRTWCFNDLSRKESNKECFQCVPDRKLRWRNGEKPLDYIDERTLRSLTFVLDQAHNRGLKVILPLVNNWSDYGGVDRYTKWYYGTEEHDKFYTNDTVKQWYRDYAEYIVSAFRDHPAVFAWELMNEPRVSPDSSKKLHRWIGEMSAFINSIDPNHMITIGMEGEDFSETGTKFVKNHRFDWIDFATIHVWPQNQCWDPLRDPPGTKVQIQNYLRSRFKKATFNMGKPVVLEEFGIPRGDKGGPACGWGTSVEIRNELYRFIYGECLESSTKYGGCDGSLLWVLMDETRHGPEWCKEECGDDGIDNHVYLPEDAATDTIIRNHVSEFATRGTECPP